MNIPEGIRSELVERLWSTADEIRWTSRSNVEKSRYYDEWTRDPAIGGILGRYMDVGQVRVYLKDTLLKPYPRARMAEDRRPTRALGIPDDAVVAETFIKPHGWLLEDGRLVCWGRADDWKVVLMAVHERAFTGVRVVRYAAVLSDASGRFREDRVRTMVQDAATRLGVERVVWLDD